MKAMKRFIDFEIRKVDGEERTYWFTASTEDRARDGHVIVQKGWKLNNFKRNPVILWAHQSDQLPIGRAVEIENDGELRLKIQFAPEDVYPFARTVEKMIEGGYLRTGSVGFTVYKTEELTEEEKKMSSGWGLRLYAELLEFSIVPVPADTGAKKEGREISPEIERELIARSVGAINDLDIKRSSLLPYEKDGEVDDRLLRASWGALNGLRGGVNVPNEDFDACRLHLQRVASGAGVNLPVITTDDNQNRESFADVWDDELLDIVTAAQDAQLDRAQKDTKCGQDEDEYSAILETVGKGLDKILEAVAPKN